MATGIDSAAAVTILTAMGASVVAITALKIGPAALMTAARWVIASILK